MKRKRGLVMYFSGSIGELVAKQLTIPATLLPLESSKETIEAIVQSVPFHKYEFVLGLGQYAGRDRTKLRLECKCNQRWRNQSTLGLEKTQITPFLHETPLTKLTFGLGNSYCNLLSILIINRPERITYNFVHIPQDFSVQTAASELEAQLIRFMFGRTQRANCA